MNKLPIFEKGYDGGINFRQKNSAKSYFILSAFFILLGVGFISIVLRLFQLSIVKGAYYRKLSENNRMREIIIEPERGVILDRKGIVLAHNVSHEQQDNKDRIYSRRIYTNPEAFAHVVGYRQTADTSDMKFDPCVHKMILGDKIGKKAIEKSFECDLRGKRGKKLVEINARGEYIQTLSRLPPINGKTLQLAIDEFLQSYAYDLIKEERAVVIALKPKTGEILTLVSSPSYNTQYFEDSNTNETVEYFSDLEKPLFNRATEGVYPPGSTYKLVIATAALEENKITADTEIEDTGTILAGAHSFGNWYFLEYGKTEGMVDVLKALRRSNDIYFYKIGERLGPIKIKEWSEIFGYGEKTSLPLDEKTGTIPSPFWKEETLSERWFLGDTYNLSIGQGYLSTTPMQVTLMTSVFANDGYYCKPNLLKVGTYSNWGQVVCKKLPIAEATLSLIKKGMTEACSAGGTGWPFFEFKINEATGSAESNTENKEENIQVACKTGTAESHDLSGKPHAWFTTYAPAEKPEIIVTVLVEAAGQGSDVAAPIAKNLLKRYFERVE